MKSDSNGNRHYLHILFVIFMVLNSFGLHLPTYTADQKLYWPSSDGKIIAISEPFGPRNLSEDIKANGTDFFHVGLDLAMIGDIYNPWRTGTGQNPGKATIESFGGAYPNTWVIVKNTDFSHEVKRTVYWHVNTSGLAVNTTVASGAKFPFSVYTGWSSVHLHFETYDKDLANLNTTGVRMVESKNPLRWLDYTDFGDFKKSKGILFCNINSNTWYAFNTMGAIEQISTTGLKTSDYERVFWVNIYSEPVINYPFSTIADTRQIISICTDIKRPQFDIQSIELIPQGTSGTTFFNGAAFFDLEKRTHAQISWNAQILYDLGIGGGFSPPLANNQWYHGNRIQSQYWHSNVATEKKSIYYYFLPVDKSIASNQKFDLKVTDLYGRSFTWAGLGRNSCIDCTPSNNAPPPPASLTAQQTTSGISLTWLPAIYNSAEQLGYRIYRRPATSPGMQWALPVAYIEQAGSWVNNLSAAANGDQILPGNTYLYSIAAINRYGEGCNGPFNGTCNWQANGCSICSVKETSQTMPSAATFTIGNRIVMEPLGTVNVTNTLNIQNVEIRNGASATFNSKQFININETTIIEEGANVTFNIQ